MPRLIKVEEHWYNDGVRDHVYSRIRLKGRWLRDAGFEPGTRVKVKVETGQLVIERIENE